MSLSKDKIQKEALSNLFEETAILMDLAGENVFKVRAYQKAAAVLKESSNEISLKSIASGEVKIPGIGQGIRAAIKEFLEEGDFSYRKELREKIPDAVFEIMKIPGLGPKKAMLLVEQLGVQNIGELEYACRENRLIHLKGFGEKTQKKTLDSIEILKQHAGLYRLYEAVEIGNSLVEVLYKHLGKGTKLEFVGGLARNAEVIDVFEVWIDEDIQKIKKTAEKLSESKLKEHSIEKAFLGYGGETKIDEAQVSFCLWGSIKRAEQKTILYLDGKLRNQYSSEFLKKTNLFRPAWLEAKWIEAGVKPTQHTYNVSDHGSVKGIFHCHTTLSDGTGTLEEMVLAAQKLGYQYIGISDHSQSAFYARGLKPDQIIEQSKKIKELQKKVSIRIFHGIESDILADGELDYDEKILDVFDFVIGSIHSRFKMNPVQMTQRICEALSNPKLTMWGHPTGRLLLSRPGYEIDWEQCFRAASKNNVVIELNANPHRLDLDWRFGLELKKHHISICINPDAHDVEGIEDTKWGELMAEKAMLPVNQILNFLDVDQMEKYLWERKKKKA